MKYEKLILCILLVLGGGAVAEEQQSPSDWHFVGNVAYTSRSLDGTIVDKSDLSSGAFGALIATGDSMGVDKSHSAMLSLTAQYKRFGFGINYMPTSFKGEGYALIGAGVGGGGGIVKTPLSTDINISMLLASSYYNFIQTPKSVFGVGVGLGQSRLDISIVPDYGNSIVYDGTTPFGFLNLHFSNRYKRFLYGLSVNAISAEFGGSYVDFLDYKIDLGYRLFDGKVKGDLIGGYREVNFAVKLDGESEDVKTDFALSGPFLGIRVIY
ncbi:MAG: hypothetical protein ABFR33_01475 [Verrucomicrobiota bacterium]